MILFTVRLWEVILHPAYPNSCLCLLRRGVQLREVKNVLLETAVWCPLMGSVRLWEVKNSAGEEKSAGPHFGIC